MCEHHVRRERAQLRGLTFEARALQDAGQQDAMQPLVLRLAFHVCAVKCHVVYVRLEACRVPGGVVGCPGRVHLMK
jgi:hypothetical protein